MHRARIVAMAALVSISAMGLNDAFARDRAPAASPQIALPRVELMPNEPAGFKLLDFNAIAHGYDRLVFDPDSSKSSAKLMWWDDSKINIDTMGIGMPSYVDRPGQTGGTDHEAITVLGSVLGASVAGIDMSEGPHNFAATCAQYFNSKNGTNLVLNHVADTSGHSYWYEIFPQILFDSIAARYPAQPRLTEISDIAARRWLQSFDALAQAGSGTPSFEHLAFDFSTMKPVEDGKQREPDAAAGLACLFVSAFERTHDAKFLNAANVCLKTLEARENSPSYEILMPFGAYAAARLNAEHGTQHDAGRLLNDFFEPRSDVRAGWGLIIGNWNGVEVSGLIGSVNDAGGYGFTMNTFATAAAVLPIARYDERYARAVGKWMLNAAGAIRYVYPGQLPLENTSKPKFTSDPANVIAFEGIRHRLNGKSPLAGGDPTVYGWGPCDLGLYGSGFVGVFGGSIRPTSDPMILQLDLLAADPCPPARSLPTHLYFNPHHEPTTIHVDVGPAAVDLYDSLENRTIATKQAGVVDLALPPDAARMIVRLPAGSAIVTDGRQSKVGDVVIDYDNGLMPPPPIPERPVQPSKAKVVDAMKFTPTIDGKVGDWKAITAPPLKLTTGGRGSLEAEAQFAWDDQYLYVLVRETKPGKDVHEAADLGAFEKTPWDFDAVNLYLDFGNGRRPSLGDFVLQLAWTSSDKRNIAFSAQAPDDGSAKIVAATGGTAKSGDRVIEARVSWTGLAKAAFGDQATAADVKAGMTLGCEPCLVEMNHTRQSFLGGSQYQRPTGTDANSTDLALKAR